MSKKLAIAMFGQKRLSREGGVEIVVKELCTRMAQNGCNVTCYNRAGHHVSGAEYDDATIEYKANVEAIRVLQTLDAEQRQATAEEQEILSRYVGWGGIPQAFDESNAEWSKEYAELQSLLTADEYKEARASTLNAFYTSPTVIKAMYEALGNMGLSKGNVLEPSCGVGNFMGLVPDSMEKIRMYGVELDSISGRIAQQL